MDVASLNRPQPVVGTLVGASILIAGLYFGRDLLVPIALAILLSFVLAPLVRSLQRWGAPKKVAIILVVVIAFAGLIALGAVMAKQVAELAGQLPTYQATIREKIEKLRNTASTSSPLERAADVLHDLGRELNKPKDNTPLSIPLGQEIKPIPVEVRQPPPTPLESLSALISPLLGPLTTTAIIAIFVVFILFQREDLRNRFIKLAGAKDLHKTTAALDDAGERLGKLLLMQLVLNTGFGVFIGCGLWLIGIPSPVLWGILAAILRFVPYIGAFISAALPLVLAAAVDPGWSMVLWTAALFLVGEPFTGYVVEPLAYGHSTGLSPVAVIASATLWSALWGPVGLVLAVPLTVCLVVLGRHVDRFKFLDIMLGDRPALSPAEIFYQRMLAGDPAEAVDKAEEFLKERPLSAYYDDVALPALRLAQADFERGALDLPQSDEIKSVIFEVVEDLSDKEDRNSTGVTNDAETNAALETVGESSPDLPRLGKEEIPELWATTAPAVCVAAQTPLDEGPAIMLAQLLQKHGVGARAEAVTRSSGIVTPEMDSVQVVYLSYLGNSRPAHMRYLVRRWRRTVPGAKIVLCCWDLEMQKSVLLDGAKPDFVVTTLREAIENCLQLVQTARTLSSLSGTSGIAA